MRPPCPLAIASCAAAIAFAACSKPERPLPNGPGRAADAGALRVEEVPQPPEAARASSLTAEQRAIVVASIGDRAITLGELEARLDAEPPVVKSQFASIQKRKEYLAKLVQFEVLVLEAQRQRLDRDPEVVEAMRQAMVRKFLHEEGKVDDGEGNVPEADLRAYYDANPQVFKKPAQVELSHMLFSDRAKADQVRVELDKGSEGNAGRLVAMWNDYVVRLSEDKVSSPYLGALGLVSAEPPPGADEAERARLAAIPKALIDAALQAEPHAVGPVIGSDKGFHVWMITSRSAAVDKSFDDAKASIKARIVKRERDLRRQKRIDDLRARAKVTIDDDAVRLIAPPKLDRAPKLGGPGHAGHGHGEAAPATATGAP